MMDQKKEQVFSLLQDLVKDSRTLGATDVDVVFSDSSSISVSRRLGEMESVHRSEEINIGLRVFIGKKSAIVSSSDISKDVLKEMVARAISMAKIVPEDIYAGIADGAELATQFPDLDLYDDTTVSIEKMNEYADRAETAARDVKGVINSEGAHFSYGQDSFYYVASNGFSDSYTSSEFSLFAAVIAGDENSMEEDYNYDSTTFFKDLKDPETIGRLAGERAVRSLNPQKIPTAKVPVVFDRRVSNDLVNALAYAISGTAVARGTTLLKDKMGCDVFSSDITIIDDPFLRRGCNSHPFDGEGVAPQKRSIIDKGVLSGWLLDLSSARQLGLKTTGNAGRAIGGVPSPRVSNFYMQAGELSVEDLIKDIESGFFVTSLMGGSPNLITGDYSSGAKGFWIEKGQISYPVSELTIAGNIKEMWRQCIAANDLELKYGVDAPTLFVGNMMVAGV